VYLYAYYSVSEAKNGLRNYFTKYNQHRPHSVLDDKTPDEFYFDNLPAPLKTA
jgi:putative transposase